MVGCSADAVLLICCGSSLRGPVGGQWHQPDHRPGERPRDQGARDVSVQFSSGESRRLCYVSLAASGEERERERERERDRQTDRQRQGDRGRQRERERERGGGGGGGGCRPLDVLSCGSDC